MVCVEPSKSEFGRSRLANASRGIVALDVLPVGRCGEIVEISCRPEYLNRLAGLGICTGRVVQLIRRGDPMILRAFGTRIGISARLAAKILLAPCPEPECPDAVGTIE